MGDYYYNIYLNDGTILPITRPVSDFWRDEDSVKVWDNCDTLVAYIDRKDLKAIVVTKVVEEEPAHE